jgi:transcriptional regulator with XRE-family HTH domain
VLDIGLEIRILRERLKVSAKELAGRVGLSQSQMSRLEKGQRRIDTQVLRRIATALDVDPSYFFRGGEAPGDGVIIPAPMPAEIGKILRSERRRRHISAEDLASRVGRPKAVIQKIEEGNLALDPELAQSILKALRLAPSFLLGAQERVIEGLRAQVARLSEALAESSRGDLVLAEGRAGPPGERAPAAGARRRGVPLLGSVADGYPRAFDAAGRPALDVEDFLYLPGLDADGAFALHAVGDSMKAGGHPSFREGDLLVFADEPLLSRDFALARVGGEGCIFRQVFFEAHGRVRLQPLNLAHPAATLTREETVSTWKLVAHVARH